MKGCFAQINADCVAPWDVPPSFMVTARRVRTRYVAMSDLVARGPCNGPSTAMETAELIRSVRALSNGQMECARIVGRMRSNFLVRGATKWQFFEM
jgi:hypothetical protein